MTGGFTRRAWVDNLAAMRNQMVVRNTGIMAVLVGLGMVFVPGPAGAQLGGLTDKAKGAAESGAKGKIEKEVNAKLLAEGRKNQCSFKTDSDQLAPGCDPR